MDHSEINHYYDNCLEDYRAVWGANEHFSMHMGLHDPIDLPHNEAVVNLVRKVSSVAAIRASDKVIDAGCGIGGSCIWIAQNSGAHITGLNINPNHLEIATANVRKLGLVNNVEFITCDYLKVPLSSNSIDVIYAIESVCHSENKVDFLLEAYRLLKPGGRLIVADHFWKRPGENAMEQKKMTEFLKGWAMPNLSLSYDFLSLMQQIGFRETLSMDLTDQVLPSFRRLRKVALLSMPFEIFGKVFRFRKAIHMENTVASINTFYLARRGISSYSILFGKK